MESPIFSAVHQFCFKTRFVHEDVFLIIIRNVVIMSRKLYWSECSFSGRIEWSYLDGSGRQTVRPADSCPRSLKLDYPTQTLYWVNFADDQIHMHYLSTGELRVRTALIHATISLHGSANVRRISFRFK